QLGVASKCPRVSEGIFLWVRSLERFVIHLFGVERAGENCTNLNAEEREVAGRTHEENDDERQIETETGGEGRLPGEGCRFRRHWRSVFAGGFHPAQDLLVCAPYDSPNVEH